MWQSGGLFSRQENSTCAAMEWLGSHRLFGFCGAWSEGWEETGDRQAEPSVAFCPQTSEDAGAQGAAREGLQGSAIESRGAAAGGWAGEEGSLG